MRPFARSLIVGLLGASVAAPSMVSAMPPIDPAPARSDPALRLVGGFWHPWSTVEAQAAPGRQTRIRAYRLKCDVGGDDLPAFAATANHGTVTLKNGFGNDCGRKMSIIEIWYQPDPGFHGVDEVSVTPMYEAISVMVR